MIVQKKYKVSTIDNEIEVVYTASLLSDIKIIAVNDVGGFAKMVQSLALINIIHDEVEVEGCTIKELKVNIQKQKIALWCQLYKMRYGNDYKVTQREAGMLKNIELTQELITTFFNSKEWYAKEKTIARITSNYNELKRISNNQQQTSGKSSSGTQANGKSLADEFRKRYK